MPVVAFDEMLPDQASLRRPYEAYDGWLKNQDPARLAEKMRDAERVFRKTGITFAVYGEQEASERLIPFDIVPRIISGRNASLPAISSRGTRPARKISWRW